MDMSDKIYMLASSVSKETGCCIFTVRLLVDAFGLNAFKITQLAREYHDKHRHEMSVSEFIDHKST